jgi:rubrerythrin
MTEEQGSTRAAGDFIRFWPAGLAVKGEFHCSDCGYGVTIHRALPICPMCGGESWEQTAWHPFSRANADAFARDLGTPIRG